MLNSKLFENPEYEEQQLNPNVYLRAQQYANEYEWPTLWLQRRSGREPI